jgi:hypothetical protein
MVAMVVKVDGPGRAAMAETVPPAALAAAAAAPEQLVLVDLADLQARAALVAHLDQLVLMGEAPLPVLPV